MIILRKKVSFFSLLFILILLTLILFSKYVSQYSFKSFVGDTKQSMMLYDHGFSSPRSLLADNSNIYKIPLVFPKNIYKSIRLQIQGFPGRPAIEKIEISIKFKNYRKILDDRDRFLRDDYSSDHQKVSLEHFPTIRFLEN